MKKLFVIAVSALVSVALFSAMPAFAQPKAIPCVPSLPCVDSKVQTGETPGGVQTYVKEKFGGPFLAGFLGLMGATSVVFLIIGGLQLHLAMGNEETLKKGKTTIIWAIVGLVIAILSVAIVQIISSLDFK